MKLEIFKSNRGEYHTIVFDETKMIPDPAFVRQLNWGPADPQQDGETDQAYNERVALYEEQISQEAVLSYRAEMGRREPAVKVAEQVIDDLDV